MTRLSVCRTPQVPSYLIGMFNGFLQELYLQLNSFRSFSNTPVRTLSLSGKLGLSRKQVQRNSSLKKPAKVETNQGSLLKFGFSKT